MNCNFMYIFLLVTTEIAFCLGISTEQLQGSNAQPLQSDTNSDITGAHEGLVKRSPAFKRLPGWSVYYGKRSADTPSDSNDSTESQAERILEDISSELVQDPQNDREEKLKDIYDFEKWMQHNDDGEYNSDSGSGGDMAKRMDIKRLQSWMSSYGKRDNELANNFITDEDLNNQALEGHDGDSAADDDDLKRAAWFTGYGKRPAWFTGYGKRSPAWFSGYGKRSAWLTGYGKKASPAWFSSYGKRGSPAWFSSYGKRGSPAWFSSYGKRGSPAWFSSYGKKASPAWFSSYGKRGSPAWFSSYGKKASPAWFSSYGKRSPAWFSGYGKRSPAWFSGYGKRSPAWFSGYGKRSQVWPAGYGRRSPAWFTSYGKRAGWYAGYGKREDGAAQPGDSDLDALRDIEGLDKMGSSEADVKDWPSGEASGQSQAWSNVL